MDISRVKLWRWKLMAEIPEDLFERLLDDTRKRGKMTSTRELANVARALKGKGSGEAEICPHCGGLLRIRGGFSNETAQTVATWLQDQTDPSAG